MFNLTLNEESLAANLDLVSELSRDCVQASGVKTVQQKSPIEKLLEGRPRLEDAQRCEKKRREVLVQLRGAFLSSRNRKGGNLSLRMALEQNCTKDVECHTP